jgi:hypothetical protein
VSQINFIIKSRAYRYVAAAKEEWLHPENYVSAADWSSLGQGYLLIPNPHSVSLGGEVMWGGPAGAKAIDAYGRRPWEKDYNKEGRTLEEGPTLYRFQGEFARIFGPYRRGRCYDIGHFDQARDSDSMNEYFLSLEGTHSRRS